MSRFDSRLSKMAAKNRAESAMGRNDSVNQVVQIYKTSLKGTEGAAHSSLKKDSFQMVEEKLSINRGGHKTSGDEYSLLNENSAGTLSQDNLNERLNEYFGDEFERLKEEAN